MAKHVEQESAIIAPHNKIGAGFTMKNQSPPAREEKRVKKSDTETFRYLLFLDFFQKINRETASSQRGPGGPGHGFGGPGGGFLIMIAVVACHYFYYY